MLSEVLIRANGLDRLRAAVSFSIPVLLLGGLCRFGGRDRRAAPAKKDPTLPQTSHLTAYTVIRFRVQPFTHHGRGRE